MASSAERQKRLLNRPARREMRSVGSARAHIIKKRFEAARPAGECAQNSVRRDEREASMTLVVPQVNMIGGSVAVRLISCSSFSLFLIDFDCVDGPP